jgi:hypothetical protein
VTISKLAKARKRLKDAQSATARFVSAHKDRQWSNETADEHRRLISAELEASIFVTDLEIAPTKKPR